MYLVVIAWIYVVLMMAVAEAMAHNGTVLGAIVTFLLYGVLPLSIVVYLMRTPARRAARKRAEAADGLTAATPADPTSAAPLGVDPDAGGHPAGAAVAAVRKEP
jgi:hypothetical protein